MRLRQFRLVIDGEPGEAAADALFGRADDLCVEAAGSRPRPAHDFDGLPCAVAPSGPRAWVAFDRMAPTLADAVVSGVRDLDAAGLATAAAVADDPLVTAEIIGERVDRPAALVRVWGMPEPVYAHPRRPVFDWPAVVRWLTERGGPVPPDPADTLEAATLALRLRSLAPRLERMTPFRSLLYP